jgi:hypothetical protein
MLRRPHYPSPSRRSFPRNQAIGIAAIDIFIVPSATFRLLFVMLILAHARRKIVRLDVTQHTTAGWLSRQVTEAFPWDAAPRFLLRDRDLSYGPVFSRRVEAMGITEVITAPRSPWQNPYVERVTGSIRRDCLDHLIVFNECHLRRVLSSDGDYYHRCALGSYATAPSIKVMIATSPCHLHDNRDGKVGRRAPASDDQATVETLGLRPN